MSPDSKRLATGGITSRVKVWNLQTGQLDRTIPEQTKNVKAIAFSSDSQTIGLFNSICQAQSPDAASVKSVQLWNWQTGKAIIAARYWADKLKLAYRNGRQLCSSQSSGDKQRMPVTLSQLWDREAPHGSFAS